jgi:hypothetical protein
MSNNPNSVNLTVNADNSYSFSGGNQGDGNVIYIQGGGQAAIQVDLSAPSGYKITSVNFSGTGSDNFSYHITQNGGGAVIQDTCNDVADVDYTVNVSSSTGANIPCHPNIKNIPQ